MKTVTRDEIEAGADLTEVEINAAKEHLRRKDDGFGCTSYIQRKMGIGYNHAARIMEYLEVCRFITAAADNGERKLIT